MSTRNKTLTGVAMIFASIIAFFIVGIFTGGGVDNAVKHTSAVSAQTPPTTTESPLSAQTPPAQQRVSQSESDAVDDLRSDFVDYSETLKEVFRQLTEAQAANAELIRRLAEDQTTQMQTACQERLKEIIANAGETDSRTTSSEDTDGNKQETVTKNTQTLMSEMLASDDGTGFGIVVNGEVQCAVIQLDTGDGNLDGAVAWMRENTETEEEVN